MKIILDKNSLEQFNASGTQEIFIHFIKKGCEWTRVEVLTEFDKKDLMSFLESGITVYMKSEEAPLFDGARITQVGEKWIFTSPKVQSRCGCGSSFSFEKASIDKRKIKNLKSLLKKGTSVSLLHEKVQKPICED